MSKIHQATDAAMRALQPPGHRWTYAEESRVSNLIDAQLQASRDADLEAYRQTATALLEACRASYRRHAEEPASFPKDPVTVRR